MACTAHEHMHISPAHHGSGCVDALNEMDALL